MYMEGIPLRAFAPRMLKKTDKRNHASTPAISPEVVFNRVLIRKR